MKKLALKIDNLQVDSFETAAMTASDGGTVLANQIGPRTLGTQNFSCIDFSCAGTTCVQVCAVPAQPDQE